MSECMIRLIRYDAENPEGKVLADGRGQKNGMVLRYHEAGEEGCRHEVLIGRDELTLRRLAEFSSETRLYMDRKGKARIESPYGILELETQLIRLERGDSSLLAEYHILQDGNTVTSQILVWEWKGIFDEQD